jgi:hypothetical protein
MKWIVLSIVISLTLYTYLTLRYRKAEPGYRPYQDSRDHATVSRLLSAGYSRITASVELPAETKRAPVSLGSARPAEIREVPGGLPTELSSTLVDQPVLPDGFSQISAPAEASTVIPYSVQFVCSLPDNKHLPGETYVYRKDLELAIVPGFEHLDGDLLMRTREAIILLTVPVGTLQPGSYQVTLIGARHSKQWTLQVH